MSPLVLALLGRQLGPSIARDLPPDLRAPANIFMNPLGALQSALMIGGGSLYDYLKNKSEADRYREAMSAAMESGQSIPPAPSFSNIGGDLANMIDRDMAMRMQTGDMLRSGIASFLPEPIANVVAPGFRPAGFSRQEMEDMIPISYPETPYQTFRQDELLEQLLGVGNVQVPDFGNVSFEAPSIEYSNPVIPGILDDQTFRAEQPEEVYYFPELNAPTYELPSVTVSAPSVSLPDISLPDISLPDMNLPDLNLPNISFDMPSNFDFGAFDNIDYGEFFRRGGGVKRKG